MTPTTQLPTKLCHLIKRPDFEGYGFNLHSEKVKPGQFIGKVDINSPAEVAGLKEGDRIIEVNAVNISHESHKQVVQRIKAMSNEVRLLIIDAHASSKGIRSFPTNIISACNRDDSGKKEKEGVVQATPGCSINISSISTISMTRSFNGDSYSVNDNLNEHNDATTNNANEILLREQGGYSFNSRSCQTTTSVRNAVRSTNTIGEDSCQNERKTSSGGLELSMTAAEMRAKLLSKKKYDPKNETVDLQKKFEIIQKL
ncbi:uncharacterized protein LOC129249822 [Anastrepha obliqua]|uniref:uncharacterized protein LOC129249822 n=1 Tax=Anastrepha obliqua TaxID=95512 RepID=UPI00240A7F6E|nr:uncharacterized protein LOC129249822 [Anastrepha obliqua]XP_054745461.1 uncharacterized protein LOC129249822 [Anastrepha obliqua]XP_054745462.1 uncharacterized protein LOC129249822 [Anastrepha obliqua]